MKHPRSKSYIAYYFVSAIDWTACQWIQLIWNWSQQIYHHTTVFHRCKMYSSASWPKECCFFFFFFFFGGGGDFDVSDPCVPPFDHHIASIRNHDLTHWGRGTHICVIKQNIIGSYNGVSPGRAPSHYLNQCWNIINSNLRNKFQWDLKRNL